MEYARNVLEIKRAEHEETAPAAEALVVSRLVASLTGKTDVVRICPNTLSHRAYRSGDATEQFRCNYGLNRNYHDHFSKGALKITGTDWAGEARIVELSGHLFFVATLFLPQLRSRPSAPHPLVRDYLAAAGEFAGYRGGAA